MMPYSNTEEGAFASLIEDIMRDVDYGWVIRYMHTTGASLFLHRLSSHVPSLLWFLSKPKELVWLFGLPSLVMMAEGFLGYVLPCYQMSYWGYVIISLFWSNTLISVNHRKFGSGVIIIFLE